MNSPHSLREVFVCLDAPTNRPPLQAFACSPLGRSDQSTAFAGVRLFSAWSLRPPELCSCDLRSNAPPDRLCRRSFSAFPSPPDRLCRRSTSDGVGCGANDRPSASAFGRVALVGFASLAPWFCSYVSAPLRR